MGGGGIPGLWDALFAHVRKVCLSIPEIDLGNNSISFLTQPTICKCLHSSIFQCNTSEETQLCLETRFSLKKSTHST